MTMQTGSDSQNPQSGQTSGRTFTEQELQEHVARAMSTNQRENANLKKQVDNATTELESVNAQNRRLNSELSTLKKLSEFDGREEDIARWQAEQEEGINVRKRELEDGARVMEMDRLVYEFPSLTKAELLSLPPTQQTPLGMENYALRNHQARSGGLGSPTEMPSQDAGVMSTPSAPTSVEPVAQKTEFCGAGNALGGQPPASSTGTDKILWALQQRGDSPNPT